MLMFFNDQNYTETTDSWLHESQSLKLNDHQSLAQHVKDSFHLHEL